MWEGLEKGIGRPFPAHKPIFPHCWPIAKRQLPTRLVCSEHRAPRLVDLCGGGCCVPAGPSGGARNGVSRVRRSQVFLDRFHRDLTIHAQPRCLCLCTATHTHTQAGVVDFLYRPTLMSDYHSTVVPRLLQNASPEWLSACPNAIKLGGVHPLDHSSQPSPEPPWEV